MNSPVIDTDATARKMRRRIIRPESREILITRLNGSAQEGDLTSPVNCGGLGRIRHFNRKSAEGWPVNFLPASPAARALGFAPPDVIEAQVFQNAACAWRCWYCYVPFELLGGDERRAEWITPEEMVERYADISERPPILDLSGGSPDLTPEWIPWTIDALERQGLLDATYLWSDDNLSTDLVFTALSAAERRQLAHPHYGRVCCFKGFDAESFAFNTGAGRAQFDLQFDRIARYMNLGIDLYGYVTLTGPTVDGVEDKVARLVERMRNIRTDLPERTVPLKIETFGPTLLRNAGRNLEVPLIVQERAVAVWRRLVDVEQFETMVSQG